jgi:hypothetical protein
MTTFSFSRSTFLDHFVDCGDQDLFISFLHDVNVMACTGHDLRDGPDALARFQEDGQTDELIPEIFVVAAPGSARFSLYRCSRLDTFRPFPGNPGLPDATKKTSCRG